MPVIPNASLPDSWDNHLLCAVGEIVIAAGQLEHVIDLSYKRLAKKDYSTGMQEAADFFRFKQKTGQVAKAANAIGVDASQLKQLQAILQRAEAAWDERNGVIHAVYAELPSGKRVRRRRISKKGQPFKSTDLGLQVPDLLATVAALRSVRDQLDQFTSRWI